MQLRLTFHEAVNLVFGLTVMEGVTTRLWVMAGRLLPYEVAGMYVSRSQRCHQVAYRCTIHSAFTLITI